MSDNVYTALAKAQANMGKAVKGSTNPHFKSKYAQLSDVMHACLPALNEQGLALWHSMPDAHTMRTTLSHGASDTHTTCDVPLIVDKNNMQGMKSATTYAKRIGVESVCGISPEDDDGNDAVKATPTKQKTEEAFVPEADVLAILRDAKAIGWTEDEIKTFIAATKAPSWKSLTQKQFDFLKEALSEKFEGDPK